MLGDRVFQLIDEADESVRRDFYDVMGHLAEDPFPGTSAAPGILPFEGSFFDDVNERYIQAAWSVPFDDGLLVYEALADYPRIYLVRVLWAYSEA